MPVLIRPIRPADAAAYLDLACALDQETKFMMMEPGERQTTVEEQRKRILSVLASGNGMIFVAEDGGRLVGMLGAIGGTYRRNHGTVHIFIGIRQAYTGQGLGCKMFETMETWARSWGARRLELTVMAHNQRGLALYQKMGFVIEGRLRTALKVDGQYIDEYMMGKILSDER